MSDFTYSTGHLLCHYDRIDLLLQNLILHNRAHGNDENKYPGLILTDREIDQLFIPAAPIPGVKFSDEMQQRMESIIKAAKAHQLLADSEGKSLRLVTVETLFGLSAIERDILLLALAPEVDQKYEKIFGYLQDDITKKHPCISLALILFIPSVTERLAARAIFESSSPLIYHKLIEIKTDPSRIDTPFPAQFLTVNKRISGYLLGSDEIDPLLGKMVTRIDPKTDLNKLILPAKVRKEIDALSGNFQTFKVCYFYGNRGTGKKTITEALCSRWQRRLLHLEQFPDNLQDADLFARQLCREAVLSNSIIACHNIDTTGNEIGKYLNRLIFWAQRYQIILFLSGEKNWEPGNLLSLQDFICIHLPSPSSDERRLIWSSQLNGNSPSDRDNVIRQIADTFKINGSQINNAISTAMRTAFRRNPEKLSINAQDLFIACRTHSTPFLSKHTRKVSPRHTWNDIVLPEDKIGQLRELCSGIKYQSVVLNEWGYEDKFALGKGTHALFAGPSGTGKTMAAEIIANDLGLELYKIDLSSIVSKYIGETEKHLSQIFDEAENCNVILFFDEADALMGKRSEVKDAHDRYANIEISYLLQRIEEFNGISLLSTNLRKNIDDAFMRRIRYIVEFPFPDEEQRRLLWHITFPTQVPLSQDIDWDFLSKKVKLAGGNIRNIIINAAYLAASGETDISMQHVMLMIKREYLKMGMNFIEADFKPYFTLTEKLQQKNTTSTPQMISAR